ncbi:MAG: hypothetical protein KDA58_01105 [Planctomycetaceae bacterium]|nr:hypothetical protein [Planctomycetaceae bacterium]
MSWMQWTIGRIFSGSNKKRTGRGRAQFRAEGLESRVLLAGNVNVLTVGNTVRVVGDNAANDVEIELTQDRLTVTGNGGTVNWQAAPYEMDLTDFGPIQDLRIVLNKGNDQLRVSGGGSLAGDLVVYTYAGDDNVHVQDLEFGSFITSPGGGDDHVTLGNVMARQHVVNYDFWGHGTFEVDGSHVGGLFTHLAGAGNDLSGISHTAIEGRIRIATGGGDDSVGLLDAHTPSWAGISTGFGDDLIAIGDSSIDQFASIWTSFGDDTVLMGNTHIGSLLNLNTSAGHDRVGIGGVSVDGPAIAVLGGGDDCLISSGSIIGVPNQFRSLLVYTGVGHDTVVLEGQHDFAVGAWIFGTGQDSLDRTQLMTEGRVYNLRLSEAPLSEQQLMKLEQLRNEALALRGDMLMLESDVEQVLIDTAEQVFFTATLGMPMAGTTVRLYETNPDGTAGSFLVELFDDGSLIHGDAVAGDGVFSNNLAIQLMNAGETEVYTALAFDDSGVERYSDSTGILGVAPLSETEIMERIDLADQIETLLRDELAMGVPVDQALNHAAAILAQSPLVAVDSIAITPASIFWTTIEGLIFSVFTDALVNSGLRAGSAVADSAATAGADPSNAAPAAADPMDICGDALVIGAYTWQFEPTDEANEIAAKLQGANYNVTALYNSTSTSENISINDFKNLREYEVVAVTTHGDSHASYGTIVDTADRFSLGELAANFADLISGRLSLTSSTFAITPRFVTRYAGSLNDSIVYIGSCRSTFNASMANAFIGRGAAAFVGYDDYVGFSFANNKGQQLFDTLVNGDEIGMTPGINSDLDLAGGHLALFQMYGDQTAKLPNDCLLLNDWDLYVEYKWPLNQRDLDTSTRFLTGNVGYACPGGDYLNWSGDDTSAGGTETVIVDLDTAFDNGQWTMTTSVDLYAGWYAPAGGSGPATLTVGLRNETTGEIREVSSRAISPGRQSDCADTIVGIAQITVEGMGDDAIVSYELV